MALVKELQPGIKIFSDAGPDLRWVGNEHGFAGETFWSTINKEELVIGASDAAYLNKGEPGGNSWIIGQCDVSIRPGWFYHAAEDSLVKTPGQLLDIYYKSVGRNGVLLLNLPPDRRGLIHEIDVAHLEEFKSMIDQIFDRNLAQGAKQSVVKQDSVPQVLSLQLEAPVSFDHIVLQEDIAKGQHVSQFRVEALMPDGTWNTIAEATTIGYKRILQIDPLSASSLRVVVTKSKTPPLLKEVGLYASGD
jgi:alpha-L-fucosidase